MTGNLLLGRVHPDLACAIALGFVEEPSVVVNLETVTVHDARRQPLGAARDWLDPADPLHAATREYLAARRDAGATTAPRPGQTGWAAAAAVKQREAAIGRAHEARARARTLLAERGFLAHARQAGLRLVGVD
jgi:hypothetical protein